MEKIKRQSRRIGIGIVGGMLLIVGIIAIPYPGPGWLIVFTALAILATEFAWAQRLLDYAKRHYDAWVEWLKRQPLPVRMAVLAATGLVVVATLWLLNVFGLLNDWLDFPFDWVNSPLFR